MALAHLARLAAPAGYTGAALALASLVLFGVVVGGRTISEAADSASFYAPTLTALGSVIALLVTLVALFVRYASQLDTVGVVGLVAALVGTVLGAGGYWTYVFALPFLADRAPGVADESSGSVLVGFVVSFLIMGLGWLAFAVALLRTRAVARWAGVLLVIGSVLTIVPMPSRTLLLSVAVACVAHMTGRNRGMAESYGPVIAC